jgi:hypothetical protein
MLVHINDMEANEVHEELMTIYADLQEIAIHESVSHKARSRAISGLCRVSKNLAKMGLVHSANRKGVSHHGGK